MIFSGETLYNVNMSLGQDLEKIESAIRSGLIADAQKALRRVPLKNTSESDKNKLAALARRASLPQLSIKWLFPLVYPSGRLDRSCSSSALLEYGASLVFAGALTEARKILELALAKNEPRALLHLAFSHTREWDYKESNKYLVRFLKECESDIYTQLVAKVNLLAALVRTQAKEASTLELCQEILRSSKDTYKRLYINALELSVQLYVARDDFLEAQKALNEISQAAPSENSPEYLYWTKWKLLLQYFKTSKKDSAPLKELIQLAEKFSHGETLRDAHLRWALHARDHLLFEHVYRGTPHPSFRDDAEKDYENIFGQKVNLSQKHYFIPSQTGFTPQSEIVPHSNAINLNSGFLLKKGSKDWTPEFKTGQLPFQLLQVSCRDFYQSQNSVELCSHLYPNSHFHPVHSIQGVFQLIKRMNESFEKHSLNARIVNENNRYTLKSSEVVFLKDLHQHSLKKGEWDLLKTFQNESERFFSRKELEKISQEAPRTLSRYLEKLVNEKELLVVGKGPTTKYFRNPEKA